MVGDLASLQRKLECAERAAKSYYDEAERLRARLSTIEQETRESCAKVIENFQETISETHAGTNRHLTPRVNHNLNGLAYAAGIRNSSLSSPHQPDWDDMRGIAPDATGNLSSEDFVRQSRDEWDKSTPSPQSEGK